MSYEIIALSQGQQVFPIQYVQENGQAILGREPCAEIYTLTARSLGSNTDYWLNLSAIGFSFMPLTAFWGNASNNANQGTVILTLYDSTKTTPQALINFSSTALKDGYQFKPMVIHATNQIKIRTDYAIDVLYFWIKPVVAPCPIQVI